jgi:hypothetical protein
VFVTPGAPLLPGSHYALTLHGVTDTAGTLISPVTIDFTTAAAQRADGSMPPAGSRAQAADMLTGVLNDCCYSLFT